ncbi:AfsR/SARP family transcriptional regulator [Streptomyces sp. KLOTTS4A1]|uniref:AfsR/SARP family transcriptional regulator n=1 Tax=Streptomyces sp. KLOTTS4A1 TaxID=3390996 RepID=UPI0039F5DE8C
MRFRVLGPLEVCDGARWTGIPAAKQRALIATLLIQRSRPVAVDELSEALWGEEAPAAAGNLIQQYVMRLRRTLGDTERRILVTRAPGYQLVLPDEEAVDTQRFDRLVARGEAAARSGRPVRAAQLLTEALGLWRGRAMADVRSIPAVDAEAARLEEQRLSALEARIEADLASGPGDRVVPELRGLVRDHPLRERLWSLLIRALYRQGRRADALGAYRELHRLMSAELGVEPMTQLREIHQRILDGEPLEERRVEAPQERTTDSPGKPRGALPLAAAGLPDVTTAPLPLPRQLPADNPWFVGREAELRRISGLFHGASERDGQPGICVISGAAGIGKTLLAEHWARQAAPRYPDGQLHVNLRGFAPSGRPLRTGDAIRRFLSAFGVPPARVPADPEAQVALYRSLVADRRLLIVLDNARDAEQVRPLLPGGPGCAVLITSRNRLTGLAVTHPASLVGLDVLDPAEARELLVRRLGDARVTAEPEAAADLIASCGRLPLALGVVSARAAAYPERSLDDLAGELRGPRTRLDLLDTGDTASDVRAVFSWSSGQLTARSAAVFRLLGLHPGPEVSLPAAASLAGIPQRQAEQALAEMSEVHLLADQAAGRFTLHDLLRAYAEEQAVAQLGAAQRYTALARLLDHYLHSALGADRLLNRHHQIQITPGPLQPGVSVTRHADATTALDWFTVERESLAAAVRRAAEGGFDTHAWQLARACRTFLYQQGFLAEQIDVHRVALTAAQRLNDPEALAYCHFGLGQALARLGQHDEGRAHLDHALRLYEKLGDDVGRAVVHTQIAVLVGQLGDASAALEHSEKALAYCRAVGHRAGEAMALNNAGWWHAQLGALEPAGERCGQALDVLRTLGDVMGEAATLDSLGFIHRSAGRHDEAIACYEQALELRRGRERIYEAETLPQLAETQLAAGRGEEARESLQRALDLLRGLSPYEAAPVRERLRELDHRMGEAGL